MGAPFQVLRGLHGIVHHMLSAVYHLLHVHLLPISLLYACAAGAGVRPVVVEGVFAALVDAESSGLRGVAATCVNELFKWSIKQTTRPDDFKKGGNVPQSPTAHSHTHSHTCADTDTGAHTHRHAQTPTVSHAPTQVRIYTHTETHIMYMRSHIHRRRRRHTYTSTDTQTHTHMAVARVKGMGCPAVLGVQSTADADNGAPQGFCMCA